MTVNSTLKYQIKKYREHIETIGDDNIKADILFKSIQDTLKKDYDEDTIDKMNDIICCWTLSLNEIICELEVYFI